MPRVIRKSNNNPWGDVLGGIGQGISGYAGGVMGRQQMDMAKENSAAMRDMMGRMWGKNGEGINAQPAGGALDTQFNSALNDTLGGGGGGQNSPAVAGDMPTADMGGMGMSWLDELLKNVKFAGGMGGGMV